MPSHSNGMDWNDQAISTLRALWTDGHSTAEIGRRMGITKNAVIGKVHRLKLSGRPSPIGTRPRAPRVKCVMRGQPTLSPAFRPAPVVAAPRTSTTLTRPVTPPSIVLPTRGACQWPVGEPRAPGFRLCDAPALCGRPYCETHCRTAYARPARVLTAASA